MFPRFFPGLPIQVDQRKNSVRLWQVTLGRFISFWDTQVDDLNPHQVESALCAFHHPFPRGAILADKVRLGKTIKAGLLLAQKWAERKRP